MIQDANVGTGHRRRGGIVWGFLLGAAVTSIIMGFLWSSDSSRQDERMRQLTAEIAERDATIETLYSQVGVEKPAGEPSTSSQPPAGE